MINEALEIQARLLEMSEKLDNGELVLLSNVREAAKQIEEAIPGIGIEKASELSDQLADIMFRCANQKDMDIFPVNAGLNDLERQAKIREALIAALPRGYVLRDIVVGADEENSGYRKICAVREEFANAPLNQDTDPEVFAGYGGMMWCDNNWVFVSLLLEWWKE